MASKHLNFKVYIHIKLEQRVPYNDIKEYNYTIDNKCTQMEGQRNKDNISEFLIKNNTHCSNQSMALFSIQYTNKLKKKILLYLRCYKMCLRKSFLFYERINTS